MFPGRGSESRIDECDREKSIRYPHSSREPFDGCIGDVERGTESKRRALFSAPCHFWTPPKWHKMECHHWLRGRSSLSGSHRATALLCNSHCQTNVETTLLHTSICESPPWYLASLDMSHFKGRIQWHPHPRLGDIMRQWDTLYNLNLFVPDALVHANVLFILCTWIWTLLVYVDALIQIYDTLMAAKLWMKEALSEWRDSLTMKAGCHHLIYFGLVWLW